MAIGNEVRVVDGNILKQASSAPFPATAIAGREGLLFAAATLTVGSSVEA